MVALVGLLWLAGCASYAPDPKAGGPASAAGPGAPSESEPAAVPDTLRINDLVTIRFTGTANPPAPFEGRIREDGTINPSTLVPSVTAAGKTALQLEADLQKEYDKYYRNLKVSVLAEGRYFFVDGEVRAPNRYQYAGGLTVSKAIGTASGFTEFANKRRVELTRANGQRLTVDFKKAQKNLTLDLPVYPNDRIYVHKRSF
jgi:polysaccharide export outer membrane protein